MVLLGLVWRHFQCSGVFSLVAGGDLRNTLLLGSPEMIIPVVLSVNT